MGADQGDLPLSSLHPPGRTTAFALVGLLTLAVLYTMYVARVILVPIVIAVLLHFLLSPSIRSLRRVGIPQALGAAVVVLGILTVVGLSVVSLSGPASKWVERAPGSARTIETKLRKLRLPLDRMEKTVEAVQDAAATTNGSTEVETVSVAPPPLLQRITGGAAALVRNVLTISFLTYFLLASGDKFLLKLVEVIPSLSDKKKAVRIARDIESNISRYLRIMTTINIALGLVTWGVLALLGMPNAALWGAIAALLNFIPYVGPIVTASIIGVAALLTFESVSKALMMPGIYLLINLLESNLISPMILGRQFPVNPVALFVGLLLASLLWGVPGAILAVPLIVTLKIFCDHLEVLSPIGAFLGD